MVGLALVAALVAVVLISRSISERSTVAAAAPSEATEPKAPTRPPWQRLVAKRRGDAATLYAAPSETARRRTMPTRWLERGTLTFLVVDREPGWVKVMLPREPNGSTAWIRAEDVRLSTTDYAITVNRARHRVTVRRRGQTILSAPVAVGAPATPTPAGRFYVATRVKLSDPESYYGPWALGLSAHSEVLASFNGQPAQIGLHGTNEPQLIGQSVSNGCIRMPNWVSAKLGPRIPLGTPVTIV